MALDLLEAGLDLLARLDLSLVDAPGLHLPAIEDPLPLREMMRLHAEGRLGPLQLLPPGTEGLRQSPHAVVLALDVGGPPVQRRVFPRDVGARGLDGSLERGLLGAESLSFLRERSGRLCGRLPTPFGLFGPTIDLLSVVLQDPPRLRLAPALFLQQLPILRCPSQTIL